MLMPEVAGKKLLGVSMVSDIAPQLVIPRDVPTRKLIKDAIDSVAQLTGSLEIPTEEFASTFLENE
jgi:hypothetical protein